jgi:hypothetical protein
LGAILVGILACSAPSEEPTAPVESDFTGYEYVEGFSNEPFRVTFSPALLIADREMRIMQGRGSLIVGADTPRGMCVIGHDLGARLTKNREYVFEAGTILAIDWRDIQFTHRVEPATAPVPTVRVRLREYNPQGRRVADYTKFTLYCYNSEFDPVRKMPTASDVTSILRKGMYGTSFRLVTSPLP